MRMKLYKAVAVLTLAYCLVHTLEAGEDHLRQTLEKEILKHTIQYLRTKLVKCLRDVPGGRTKILNVLADGPYQPPSTYRFIRDLPRSRDKRWSVSLKSHNRKVEHHFEERTLFQVDMDVMLNTRDYLYTRALECLKSQKDRKGHKFNPNKPRDRSRVKNFLKPSPETLPVTTEPSFRMEQMFEVAGKQIQCESVTTRPDGSQLLCRNLWVDGTTRLPNWSLCPPRYNPDAWWQLNSIQSATFQVLDLEGFCQTIGLAAGIKGKVIDVKVAWDCDQTKPRMKWLDGKWAGQVDDNGFLRDLDCEYEPVT